MRKRANHRTLANRISLFLIFGVISSVHAQTSTKISSNNLMWMDIGIGSVGYKSFGGFSYGTIFSFHPDKFIYSGRYLTTVNPLMVEIKRDITHIENIKEVSLLFGMIKRNNWGFASFSTGVGTIFAKKKIGVNYNKYKKEDKLTIGIPVESQLFITPTPVVGLGIYLLANINNEANYVGLLLCLQFGKLR